jgi:glutamate synthase (NADPH/NADH) small chain
MSCAYYLSLLGHRVTVFEAQPVAGGVPRFGIPEYHLPREIVDREIKEIADLGVEIKLNTKVGKDIPFNTVIKEFDACFIAAGAHRSTKLGIPGEDNKDVISGLGFLRSIALGEKVKIGKKVVVVGGGNVAMDVARTTRRLGATDVHVVCLESREEMPAYTWEIADAEIEGINIDPGWGPSQIISDKGKVSAIEFNKCVSVFDSDGKFNPKYDKKANLKLECNTVITAIGERVELPFPEGTVKMAGPVIEVDDLGRTSKAGVYAGGDATNISRSVVEAIASGKRAALGIDLFLNKTPQGKAAPFRKGKNGAISMGRYLTTDTRSESSEVVEYEKLNLSHFTNEPRVTMKELPVKTRLKDFRETKSGFSKENAITEASRCFHCGTCIICEVCYISCPDMAITLSAEGPSFSREFEVCKSCGICIYECPRNALSWEGVA